MQIATVGRRESCVGGREVFWGLRECQSQRAGEDPKEWEFGLPMPEREYRYPLLGSEVAASESRGHSDVADCGARPFWGKLPGRKKRFPPRLSNQPCLVSGTPLRSPVFFAEFSDVNG